MLKIKVEQPLREYVSLDSLPIGAVFVRRPEDYGRSDKFFMKTKVSMKSFPFDQEGKVCDAICLNDGIFYLIQEDTEVQEVKAELTINDFLT